MLFNNITLIVLFLGLVIPTWEDLASHHHCQPFGVRLILGAGFADKTSSEKLSVRFNTKAECPLSYVLFEKEGSISKVKCTQSKIQISSYTIYSHACSVHRLSQGEQFSYLAYGWGPNVENPLPSHSSKIQSHLFSKEGGIRIVTLADWGFIVQKKGRYDTLDEAMNYLLAQDHIDLLYINGDVAYDLSSNEGTNYQQFLSMLTQVAARWPMILGTGNHQRKTQTDLMVLRNSFDAFNLTATNLTTIDLGAFNLLLFDPFEVVINQGSSDYLLPRFEAELQRLEKLGKPVIPSSHYPLTCSGIKSHCGLQQLKLQDFFDAMVKYRAIFYFGSHYHTYERLYPYLGKQQFNIALKQPYTLGKNSKYLLSVVEGIAGNDDQIIETYDNVEPFTAYLSYGKTDYGIMTVSAGTLVYQHFLATQPAQPIDRLLLDYSGLFEANLRTE